MSPDSQKQILDAVQRASARSARLVHQEMKRGMNSLATIAATAVFVGTLGTVFGIMFDTFFGMGMEKRTALGLVALNLAKVLLPTAWGILLAVGASCGYKYLFRKVSRADMEVQIASEVLANYLRIRFLRDSGS